MPRNKGHNYSGNSRNYDTRNNNTHQNNAAAAAAAAENQSSHLNRIVMDFAEFPSLNDANITTTTPMRSTIDHNISRSTTTTNIISGNNPKSSTNIVRTSAGSGNNQPMFMDGSSATTSTNQSGTGNNRHYHHGGRRTGGNYKNRDHNQGGAAAGSGSSATASGNNYGRNTGNYHRSTNNNTSYNSSTTSTAAATISSNSPSNNNTGGAHSVNTSTTNNTTQRNHHEGQHHHHHQQQQQNPSGTNATRPRGNRRGMNSNNMNGGGGGGNYDRRSIARDFNQLPNIMNGVRLTATGNVAGGAGGPSQIPMSYFNGNRGYPPMMAGIPPNVPIHTMIPMPTTTTTTTNVATAATAIDNINNTGVIGATGGGGTTPATPSNFNFNPADATADRTESELYKNLTSDPSVPRDEQALYQLEFYFSNCNLRHDGYLRTQMDADGYVPAEVVLNFYRLSKYDVTIPELHRLMMKTKKLENMVVNGRECIRRKDDPTKWTTRGLEQQRADFLGISLEDALLLNITPESAAAASASVVSNMQQQQHVHHPITNYSIPYGRFPPQMHHPHHGYMPQYPQIPVNYNIYGYDDMNGNIFYDGTLPPFDMNAIAYVDGSGGGGGAYVQQPQEAVGNHNNQPGYVYASNDIHATSNIRDIGGGGGGGHNYPTTSSRATNNDATSKNIETIVSDVMMNESSDSNFQLSTDEYTNLLKQVKTQRDNRPTTTTTTTQSKVISSKEQQKLYRYWTQNLVLNFEQSKYDLFKKYAVEDSKRHHKEGITLLYQFYERFLHRFPLRLTAATDHDDTSSSSPAKRLSLQIFDDFQQISYDDYINNESVSGLKKLLRFQTQFSNPSCQPPCFKPFVQETIDNLGLDDTHNNPATVNGDRSSTSSTVTTPTTTAGSNKKSNVDKTDYPSSTTTRSSDKQSNLSTHH